MTTAAPPEPRRPVRRRDPEDQEGWGDVPTSALEHPFLRLLQVLVLIAGLLFALDQLDLLRQDPPSIDVVRITGEDPVTAAATAAREAFGGGVDTVILVGDQALADGVVASGLAGVLQSPVLLNQVNRMDPQTRDVVRELDVTRAYLIGGTGALGGIIERTLAVEMDIEVIRIAGASRFDTAGRIADEMAELGEIGTIEGQRTGLVVPADDVPLGLVAGGIAAGRTGPLPVVYSQDGALPSTSADALGRLGVTQVIALGPLSGFAGDVVSVDGPVGIADATAELRGFQPSRLVVVPDGDDARALIGAPIAGRESGVILPFSDAQRWLADNCGTINELFVIAEPTVVSDADVEALELTANDCAD